MGGIRLAAALGVLLAGGCASAGGPKPAAAKNDRLPFFTSRRDVPIEPTVVSYPDYRDPLIKVNRAIFAFNDVSYRYALIPLAKGYEKTVPSPGRTALRRFFRNVRTPIFAANHLLKLDPAAAGRSLARFAVNSTAGIGGLFDPAAAWFGLEREEAHFDDVLARYGLGYGIYLVVPLLGPSDVPGVISLGVEYFADPIPYVIESPESSFLQVFDSFQEFSPLAGRYETLRARSDDPYLFFRNLYLQGAQRDRDYRGR